MLFRLTNTNIRVLMPTLVRRPSNRKKANDMGGNKEEKLEN